MLDEDAYFRGQSAACRPNRKDRHRSFKGSQKAYNGTFSEFCGEEPCWHLGNPKMFKDTHPHLFNIAGSKDSRGDNMLCVRPEAKAPRLRRATLDKDNRSKAIEIFRRFRHAVPREVLRSGDENDHRLRESARNQGGVRKVA